MSDLNNNFRLVLFDGVCNFCDASVNWIIKHDKKNKFKFATLQSEIGKKMMLQYGIDPAKTDSAVLIENNSAYIKSTAVLKIAKQLNALYPLAYGFIIIPKFLRDAVYDFISRNRYKWWGKKDSCMIPTKEIKEKFI